MIKDCFGNVARVGDKIAYSVGNSGTFWQKSIIERITDKSVMFKGVHGSSYAQDHNGTVLRRSDGCFSIDLSQRGKIE